MMALNRKRETNPEKYLAIHWPILLLSDLFASAQDRYKNQPKIVLEPSSSKKTETMQ